jgi:hypothetical protein
VREAREDKAPLAAIDLIPPDSRHPLNREQAASFNPSTGNVIGGIHLKRHPENMNSDFSRLLWQLNGVDLSFQRHSGESRNPGFMRLSRTRFSPG